MAARKIEARAALPKETFLFLVVVTALGLFFSLGRIFRYPFNTSMRDELTYSSPLGLICCLLDVVPLPLSSIMGKTVSLCSSRQSKKAA